MQNTNLKFLHTSSPKSSLVPTSQIANKALVITTRIPETHCLTKLKESSNKPGRREVSIKNFYRAIHPCVIGNMKIFYTLQSGLVFTSSTRIFQFLV